jgi:hypothetical protein
MTEQVEKQIALYRHMEYDFEQIKEVDESVERSVEWARMSVIMTVSFSKYSEEEMVAEQLAALNRKEQVARNTLQRSLISIAKKRAELQRLPFIPAAEVVPGADLDSPTDDTFDDNIPF